MNRQSILTSWRALAARRPRLAHEWRGSLQAQHLNTVQSVNMARQSETHYMGSGCTPAPWKRSPRLESVLLPRGSGRASEMMWRGG